MTLRHVIDLIHLHHPELGETLLTKLINTGQRRFVKDTYCLTRMSKMEIGAASVTLDGSTAGVPVNIEAVDDSITLQAYKDESVDTVTVLPSSSVLYYTGFVCRDENGGVIERLRVVIQGDGTVFFYDQDGQAITEFPSDIYYLDVHYIEAPAPLSTTLSASLDIDDDYCEAIANEIIARFYVGKKGIDITTQLTSSKHFKNLYLEQKDLARRYYHRQRTLMPITGTAAEDFTE